MPASADYLTKYLTASNTNGGASNDFEDSSRPKKRRKKDKHQAKPESSTLLIADDDDGLLLSNKQNRDEDDEDGPLIFEGRTKSAEFRKKKSSAWQTVSDQNDGTPAPARDDAEDEADRIIAAAARESNRRIAAEQDEEAPAVVEDVSMQDSATGDGPKMTSGAKVGLQTAEDTALLLAAEQAREEEEARAARRKKKTKQKDIDAPEPEEETIYRDATGRRIDVSLRRQEARAAELAKIAAEKREREAAMGDVQLRQKEQAKADLEEAKFMKFERTAEDTELNEQQKEELRWDDPMAAYMAERAAEKETEELAKKPKSRRKAKDDAGPAVVIRKKEYLGAAAPNRYSIRPGWRWDGVDRGNGFEKEWFQARGKKQRNENLEYQWATDE